MRESWVERRKSLGHAGRLRKVVPYFLLTLACLAFCQLFVLQYGVFGSKIDWINQHSVIPDYFRKRFYETGSIIPDFAWNIGGGQNIFHLSYYGLFSPVVLLSFFFPFIRMDYYIMGSSIISYVVSVLLFYRFLEKKNMSQVIRIGTALLFALAAPMVYQFYNQLMFINYMPFLCLSLIGTDCFLKRQKSCWLLAGVVGMILTSFYFSIGGMLALCLYAVSEYMESEKRVFFLPLLKKGLNYIAILFHGILLCGVLLVPAAISIFSSRQDNIVKEQITSILSFAPLKIFYTPYGMGLSVLAVVSVIGTILFASKWQERVLPISLAVMVSVPVIGFLLNGGLYDKQKVFIPFVPLVCLQCGRYLSKKPHEILPWILTGLLLYFSKLNPDFEKYMPLVWADFAVMLLCFLLPMLLAKIVQRIRTLPQTQETGEQGNLLSRNMVSSVLMLYVSCLLLFLYNMEMHPERERMIPEQEYKNVVDSQKIEAVREVLDADDSFYRLEEISDGTTNHNNVNRIADIRQNITSMYSSCYNKEYWSFRNTTFALNEPFRNCMMQSATDNPCFLQLMGVKYLLGSGQTAGYEPTGNGMVFKNSSTAPILYVTDQIVSEETYRQYSFPTNQTALLYHAVVPGREASSMPEKGMQIKEMAECGIMIPECSTPERKIKKTADGYTIRAKEEVTEEIKIIEESAQEKNNLFALILDVENKKPNQDMHIRINGQTNRLTAVSHEYANQNTNFTFLVSKGTKEETVSIQFSEGNYKIRNIRAFTGNLEDFKNPALYQNPVVLEKGQKLDSKLTGTVDVSEDGYLITSIPYDENFEIYLDGEAIAGQKVNTAFLGAKIPAGKHTIVLVYHAPGKRAGCLLTLAGIILLVWRLVMRRYADFRSTKYLRKATTASMMDNVTAR